MCAAGLVPRGEERVRARSSATPLPGSELNYELCKPIYIGGVRRRRRLVGPIISRERRARKAASASGLLPGDMNYVANNKLLGVLSRVCAAGLVPRGEERVRARSSATPLPGSERNFDTSIYTYVEGVGGLRRRRRLVGPRKSSEGGGVGSGAAWTPRDMMNYANQMILESGPGRWVVA